MNIIISIKKFGKVLMYIDVLCFLYFTTRHQHLWVRYAIIVKPPMYRSTTQTKIISPQVEHQREFHPSSMANRITFSRVMMQFNQVKPHYLSEVINVYLQPIHTTVQLI